MEFASSSLPSSSSSFLTSKPHFKHDVFINFGGEEIGRRFVSHLHSVLLHAQVKTFISQENLHKGMKLEEHMRAIGHTKITIIVFSISYAESACCLLELEKIIECHETFGQIVLPVFYEIDPYDVLHQKDDFGKALEEAAHKSYSGEQVEHALSKWRRALNTVDYCRGLPLALQFLSSYLCDKTIEGWKSVLRKLQRIPPDNLLSVLKISFEGLRDTEKDILLDVCCFFKDQEIDCVTDILNGCGLRADIGITVLIQRGFIKVDRNNKLQMHPLLQHMAREIIRQVCPGEPGKRTRLWLQDDVKDVLKENTGTEAIQGLSLKLHSTNRDCFKADAFKEMKKLRLLRLDHVQLVGDYGHISKELRWICWKGFPFKYIPNNLYMENVIAMDLKHSHLQLFRKEPFWKKPQDLEQLKFLNLSHSKYLKETPDFSKLPSLEQLILKDCPSLLKVHQSIGDLSNIRVINLKDCTSLSYLPREVYKLRSLKTLILSGCSKLDHIDITQVKSLVNIICLEQHCETNIDEL